MKHILLVEDDEALRTLLTRVLRRAGYEVSEAHNGNEAERILLQESIDLVVSDMLMPGKDGIELLMDVRKNRPDLKIVAMSGGGYTGTGTYLSLAKALGATRTLNKPFEGHELIALIESELAA